MSETPEIIQTTRDARTFLLEIMKQLSKGQCDVKVAKEIFNGSGRVVELARFDLEYAKAHKDLSALNGNTPRIGWGKK